MHLPLGIALLLLEDLDNAIFDEHGVSVGSSIAKEGRGIKAHANSSSEGA